MPHLFLPKPDVRRALYSNFEKCFKNAVPPKLKYGRIFFIKYSWGYYSQTAKITFITNKV